MTDQPTRPVPMRDAAVEAVARAAGMAIADQASRPVVSSGSGGVPDEAAAVAAVERVRKLCEEYRANCDPKSTQAQVAEIFRSALDPETAGQQR